MLARGAHQQPVLHRNSCVNINLSGCIYAPSLSSKQKQTSAQQPWRQFICSQQRTPQSNSKLHLVRCSSYTAVHTGPSDSSSPGSSDPNSQPHLAAPLHRLVRSCITAFTCAVLCAAWLCVSNNNSSGLSGLASLTISSADPASQGISSIIKNAWAGLTAGFLHTLCGPDHLAALTPLTIGRKRMDATALGALWGFGHSTGQLILGLVFVLLQERFHDFVPALSMWAGTLVPLTLITIGVMGLYEAFNDARKAAEEEAEMKLAVAGGAPSSSHSHGGHDLPDIGKSQTGMATYATGIMYGLHPDALFVVIPALALPKLAAVAYCSLFVIGTVVAMGGYTLLIGTTSQALAQDRPWLTKHLSSVACVFAILIGVLMLLAGQGYQVPFFS